MTEVNELPRYQVLQDSFIEPHYVRTGSLVTFTGSPGPHLKPINEAAEAKMEDWYNEEIPEKDEKGVLTGKMFKPHISHKFGHGLYSAPHEPHHFSLDAEPPKDMPGGMDLAQAATSYLPPGASTDQRPGPAAGLGAKPPGPAPAAKPGDTDNKGELIIEVAGKPESPATRK